MMLEDCVRRSSNEFAAEVRFSTPPALPGGAEMKSLNRKRFTQQGIERLRYDKAAAPPSGRIEIEDEACPGLLLRVTQRNTKSFSVIYRVLGEGGTSPKGRLLAGKQHRATLGATRRWNSPKHASRPARSYGLQPRGAISGPKGAKRT